MRVISKRKLQTLLAVLIVTAVLAPGAYARLLPESHHYEGSTYYNQYDQTMDKYLTGRIDFAVYDTGDPVYGGEWLNDYANPGTGQFIYAYQIFNDMETYSDLQVASFKLLGFNLDAINGTGTEYDQFNGVDQKPRDFLSTEASWEFDQLIAGEHSWYLVFSSDADYTTEGGSYEISHNPTNDPLSIPDVTAPAPVPEPATIALLGFGGMMVLAKKRKRA